MAVAARMGIANAEYGHRDGSSWDHDGPGWVLELEGTGATLNDNNPGVTRIWRNIVVKFVSKNKMHPHMHAST